MTDEYEKMIEIELEIKDKEGNVTSAVRLVTLREAMELVGGLKPSLKKEEKEIEFYEDEFHIKKD